MKASLTGAALANRVRMSRPTNCKLFFVVEGNTDIQSLEGCIDRTECEMISGYGKRAVLDAMTMLSQEDPDGTIALIDRDFGHWLEEEVPANVFTTMLYDREADFLLIMALLENYVRGSRAIDKSTELLKRSDVDTIDEIILKVAAALGRLRWISVKQSIKLKIVRVPVHEVIDGTGNIDTQKLIELAIRKTEDCTIEVADLRQMYESESIGIDDREICSGKDIVRSIAGTSKLWAKATLGSAEIDRFISSSIRCELISGLQWFDDVHEWASSRGRYIWNC